MNGCSSNFGIEMLNQRKDIDFNKGDPAYSAAFEFADLAYILVNL